MRDYNLPLSSRTLFPARLATITRTDGTILRIAEAEETITVAGNNYAPLPGCEILAVKHTLGGEMPSLEIRFAHSDGGTIDTFDLNFGKWDGAAVVVHIVDRGNLTTLGDAHFTGTIQPVVFDIHGGGAFDIRGLATQAEAVIQTYGPMCRTDLFSELCGLDAASFDHAGTVGTIVDRFNITVAGLGAPPADGWFAQGIGVAESGMKFEIAGWNLGQLKLTTYLPVCTLFTVGEDLTLYPGCDKTMGANGCGKFSNWINFQGEPHFLGASAALGG